ncbi:MAG: flavin oxidoreductase/NADH oxidase [Clostridia bacterium]|nr:flavin oxidoreductase/NADH oxidase [Clostridia bacterium]MBR6620471.1 flavin oxidoreductase/NADH oxidase [Clostridia bacterium]
MKSVLQMPLELHNRKIQNRIVFHPMEGCDGTADGAVDELTYRRYLRFAKSGAGIIWFEATAITAEGRANPRQLFLNEKTKDSFKKLISDIKTTAIKECGFEPIIIVQLTHSGRFSKPDGTPKPIVAYRNSHWEIGRENQPYVIATDEYCKTIPNKYYTAAKLAEEVGFDGIDVKCCHGYLFNEFLSATEREGMYGGSLENRTRLYFECIDAVKEAVSEQTFVTTRLNACDCFPYPYGYGVDKSNNIDLTETKQIIKSLYDKGIRLINLTLGNPYLIPHINRPCINAPEDGETGMKRTYDVTSELKKEFPNMCFIASGLSFAGENAMEYSEMIINNGAADFAGFGRLTFAYPDFYRDYLENGQLNKSKLCLKCSKCSQLMRAGTVAGCPVRDSETYMPYYKRYVLNK